MPSASISVEPPVALIDDELVIRAYGLEPGVAVTIMAQTQERNMRFYSHACFVADDNGEVDLSRMEPVSGRYSGTMPMGLICSLIQEPNQSAGRRLIKSDVHTPLTVTFSLLLGQMDSEESLFSSTNSCLASATCSRWYMGPGVQRIPIQNDRLVGTMFLPSGKGPFPGTIDLFGTVGGLMEYRAALLASRSIATLAIQYYKPPKGFQLKQNKVSDLSACMATDMEYFVDAVDLLHAHPKVSKHGIGVIGTSKGAEIAYLLAVCSPKIRACVTIGGRLYIHLVNHTYKDETFPKEEIIFEPEKAVLKDGSIMLKKMHENYVPCQHIPIERSVNGHFLVFMGDDDMCATTDMALEVGKRLRAHNKNNYEVVIYPGAGHLVEPPYSPLTQSSYHATFSNMISWGGNVRQHADAQSDIWRRIQNFLYERLMPQNVTSNSTSEHR